LWGQPAPPCSPSGQLRQGRPPPAPRASLRTTGGTFDSSGAITGEHHFGLDHQGRARGFAVFEHSAPGGGAWLRGATATSSSSSLRRRPVLGVRRPALAHGAAGSLADSPPALQAARGKHLPLSTALLASGTWPSPRAVSASARDTDSAEAPRWATGATWRSPEAQAEPTLVGGRLGPGAPRLATAVKKSRSSSRRTSRA
jgi:hypothetical protein